MMEGETASQASNKYVPWRTDCILFTVQVFTIMIIVITCLVNLSRETTNQNLWIAMLTSSVGYLMPNPKIKFNIENKRSTDSL